MKAYALGIVFFILAPISLSAQGLLEGISAAEGQLSAGKTALQVETRTVNIEPYGKTHQDQMSTYDKEQSVDFGPPLQTPQVQISGYDKGQVVDLSIHAKGELLAHLSTDEFAGMRSYIQEFFPENQSIPPASGSVGDLLDINATSSYIDSIHAFLNKLKTIGKLSLNLNVASEPTQAIFRIAPAGGGGQPRETRTNSAVVNLYRGYYLYVVEKTGFKTISASLNLVDEEGGTLECLLSPSNASDGPYPCSIR